MLQTIQNNYVHLSVLQTKENLFKSFDSKDNKSVAASVHSTDRDSDVKFYPGSGPATDALLYIKFYHPSCQNLG